MSHDAPAVTCVLIFLDGTRFIEEAIRSVVAQGDGVDWELVLVDDGSTDDSTAIARRWAAADSRIRYVEHEGHANRGMSASRNAGVAAARGEVIGFLDCDDVWLPSALAHGLRVFALHPDADVVIGGTWRWHGWTGDPADAVRDHLMSLPDAPLHTVIEPPALLAAMYADPGAWRIPAMCSLLITRRALLQIGGLDDSFRGLYEDQVLYAKIALHLRVVIDARPMALYRQHGASACQVAIDAGEWQRIGPSEPERRYLEWMRTYVTEQTDGEAAALAVVARNLDHAAHGHHVAPTEPLPSLRGRVPAPVRRVLRGIRDRVRPPARPTTVAGRWSEQFLAPISGPIEGSTLAVEVVGSGEPWVDVLPPDAFDGRAQRTSWSQATMAATRVDRVVVPLAVSESVGTAELLAGV
ncbi:MAG: glycosyltransferase family 2 protein, partial [Ilumatobacteraceae bacterium]